MLWGRASGRCVGVEECVCGCVGLCVTCVVRVGEGRLLFCPCAARPTAHGTSRCAAVAPALACVEALHPPKPPPRGCRASDPSDRPTGAFGPGPPADTDRKGPRCRADARCSLGPILVRTRPQRGGGYPPPLLQTPKWLYRTMGFVGAGDFVLGIWQGEIFLFDPMCLYSKYSEFCTEFKNG